MQCAICHDNITAETGRTVMSCGHEFHVRCIVQWLQKPNANCPCCRKEPTELERLETENESESESESESGNTYYPHPKDTVTASALMTAVQFGRVHDVQRLCTSVDLEEKDSEGDTALMWSLLFRRDEIFSLLVAAGANLLALDPERTSLHAALMTSCEHGSIPSIRACLDRGANVNYVNSTGLTPLIHAIKSYESISVAEFLIARGADVMIRDSTGMNAIMWAVEIRGGEVQWVEVLLARVPGMNPKIKQSAIKIQATWRGFQVRQKRRSCELGAWKPRKYMGRMMFTFVYQVHVPNDWFMSRMTMVT